MKGQIRTKISLNSLFSLSGSCRCLGIVDIFDVKSLALLKRAFVIYVSIDEKEEEG